MTKGLLQYFIVFTLYLFIHLLHTLGTLVEQDDYISRARQELHWLPIQLYKNHV